MEHLHFGWACLGFFLRLPLIRQFVQLLLDATVSGRKWSPDEVLRSTYVAAAAD